MQSRKQIYDTHSLNRREIVYYVESKQSCMLESCVRTMLMPYKLMDRRDFYKCQLSTIKKAFKLCIKDILKMSQKGGGELKITMDGKNKLKMKIKKCKEEIKNIIIKLKIWK